MRKGQLVTLKRLNAAAWAVQTELSELGLWSENSRLRATDVVWCQLPQVLYADALGCCFDDHPIAPLRWLGYEAGNIYIPRWVLMQGPWGQDRGSLRDVLRHEYAHALAWHYPALIRRSSRFVAAFGGRYEDPNSVAGPENTFVSAYAHTRPAEDFAETFMVWVRCGGRRPAHRSHRQLRRKWAFVRKVVQAIAKGRSRLKPER